MADEDPRGLSGRCGIAVLIIVIAAISATTILYAAGSTQENSPTGSNGLATADGQIALPAPDHKSGSTLDYAMEHRRSSRSYLNESISPETLSLILWSAQGITDPASGKRTAPSAMHTYPITLYMAVNNVTGVSPGMYTYDPVTHSISRYLDAAGKDAVLEAMGQRQVFSAPVTIILSGNSTVFTEKGQSSETALRHICLEAGHIVQNILLMETSREMAGVPFTGFNSTAVDEQLGLTGGHHVVYAVTAAYPADR